MNKVQFSIDTRVLTPDAARMLWPELFSGEAWFLLEQPKRCLCGRLPDLPPDWHEHLLSCTIFSDDAELRMEPDEDGLCCRIVCEGRELPGSISVAGYARRRVYLLRKHKVTDPLLVQDRLPRLRHTEYFVPDENSGMPVLRAERLSGIASSSLDREENA